MTEEDGCATKTGSVREFFHAGSLVDKALGSYTPNTDADSDTILPEPVSKEGETVYSEIDIIVTLQ